MDRYVRQEIQEQIKSLLDQHKKQTEQRYLGMERSMTITFKVKLAPNPEGGTNVVTSMSFPTGDIVKDRRKAVINL